MRLLFRRKTKPARGKLIVIDGIPGSGKSTQIRLLAESLTFAGFSVALAEFPQTENASAALIEKYAGSETKLTPYGEAVLYAANRMEARSKLEDWLGRGTIILASNYTIASAANGGARLETSEQVKFFRWVSVLEHEHFDVPKPDLNIILHMPARLAEILLARNKASRHARPDLAQLKKQEAAYLSLATIYPQTKLVECAETRDMYSPKDIHNIVWQLVRRVALKNNFPH